MYLLTKLLMRIYKQRLLNNFMMAHQIDRETLQLHHIDYKMTIGKPFLFSDIGKERKYQIEIKHLFDIMISSEKESKELLLKYNKLSNDHKY